MHFVCPVENQWISNELERCHTRTATLRSVFSWQQGPVFWQPDEWFGWWNDLAGSYVVLVINASFFDGHFYFTFLFWKSGKQKVENHWPTRRTARHTLAPTVQYTTPTPVHHSVPVFTNPKDHHVGRRTITRATARRNDASTPRDSTTDEFARATVGFAKIPRPR